MVEAKSYIIMTFGSSSSAQISNITEEDDRTAKERWDDLVKLYKTSKEQSIINVEQELEALIYDDGRELKTHTEKFHELLGKLSS